MQRYTASSSSSDKYEDFDLTEAITALAGAKYKLLSLCLGAAVLSALVAFFLLPVEYASEATLKPYEQQQNGRGLSSLMSELPSLPLDLGGLSGLSGGGVKLDSIVAFLESRRLQERLIEKYDLLPLLYPTKWDPKNKSWKSSLFQSKEPTAVRAIQSGVFMDFFRVQADKKKNIIKIAWECEDPEMAALMLKRIIGEISYYFDVDHVTDAKREKEFIEAQVNEVTRELEYWENRVPSADLPLAKIQREFLATKTVYVELKKQLALAKINEAKELVRFKVLDEPLVPEVKSKPKRFMIVAVATFLVGLVGLLVVLIRHHVINSRTKIN